MVDNKNKELGKIIKRQRIMASMTLKEIKQ